MSKKKLKKMSSGVLIITYLNVFRYALYAVAHAMKRTQEEKGQIAITVHVAIDRKVFQVLRRKAAISLLYLVAMILLSMVENLKILIHSFNGLTIRTIEKSTVITTLGKL